MVIERIRENLVILIGAMALVASPFVTKAIVGNPYNMKTMPIVQPWVWLYDTNQNGKLDEDDTAMVGLRGGTRGWITYVHNRKPTQKEIDWYNSD